MTTAAAARAGRGARAADWGLLVTLWVGMVAVAAPARAGDWRGARALTGNIIATDNIDGDSSGDNELLAIFSPSFSLFGAGARANAAVSYRLNASRHLLGTRGDQVSHQLEANGNAELVPDLLSMNGSAAIRQEAVSLSSGVTSSDGVSDRGDITDVFTFSLGPRLEQRFGNYAVATAGYTFGTVINDDVSNNDALSHVFNARLDSGTRFDRVSWNIRYNLDYEDEDDGDSTFQRVRAGVDIPIGRVFGLIGEIGYEENDEVESDELANGEDDEDLDGATGRIGLRFSPSRRTRLTVGADFRPFGTGPFLTLDHERRRTRFTARVEQDVTTSSRDQLRRGTDIIETDPVTGIPTIPDNNNNGVIDVPTTTAPQGNEVIVARSASGSVVYTGGKITTAINASFVDRDFIESDDSETVFSLRLSGTQVLSREWSASASARYQITTTDRAEEDDSDRIEFSLQATRTFAPNLSGTVAYRHVRFDSDDSGEDFNENRLTVGASYSF